MKIITVTLNPSLDRTLRTKFLALGYHNRVAAIKRLDPSGKGVNITRALHQLNFETHAIILLGSDPTALAYEALVRAEGFEVAIINRPGETRTATIILDEGHENETHILEESASLSEDDLNQVIAVLQQRIAPDDIVVFAGDLPQDTAPDVYARLIEVTHQAGGRAITAVGEPALGEILTVTPELVALTQNECEGFANCPIRVEEDIITCGRRLLESGANKILIEMRQSGNAMLVTAEDAWQVDLHDVIEGTSSGVWEALLAGYLAGRAEQKPLHKSLELGAAAAAYTATHVGSEFGSREGVQKYKDQIEVTSFES